MDDCTHSNCPFPKLVHSLLGSSLFGPVQSSQSKRQWTICMEMCQDYFKLATPLTDSKRVNSAMRTIRNIFPFVKFVAAYPTA